MHASQLPLKLELQLQSLQLAAELCGDAQVSRVQLSIDLLLHPLPLAPPQSAGQLVSEAVFSTPRLPKPPQERVKAAVTEAARERLATGVEGAAWVELPLEALTAAGGAARVVPVYGLRAAQACLDACGPPETTAAAAAVAAWVRVRLVGVGRGGVIELGELALSLREMAHPPQPQQGGPALRELPPPRDAPHAEAEAEARVGLACRLLPLASVVTQASRAGPPPQRAADPQLCVEMHSLKLATPALAAALAAPAPAAAEPSP